MQRELGISRKHLTLRDRTNYRIHTFSIKPDRQNFIPQDGLLPEAYLQKTRVLKEKLQSNFSLTDFNNLLDEAVGVGDVHSMEYAIRHFESHPILSGPILNNVERKIVLLRRLSRGYMNGAELNKRLYMNTKNSPEIEKAKKYGDEAIRLWQRHKDLELEIKKLSSPNQ